MVFNESAWEKVAQYKAPPLSNTNIQHDGNPASIPIDLIQQLWTEHREQYKSNKERAEQKKYETTSKLEQDRERGLLHLKETVQKQEQEKLQQAEEEKQKEIERRNEAREKARQERLKIAQTIDMDEQQQIIKLHQAPDDDDDDNMDADEDDESDDDMGGF